MTMAPRRERPASIVYPVTPDPVTWVMRDEDNMPESPLHREASETLRSLLACWIERTGRDAEVGCNRGVRWDAENPMFGVDPDVYVIEPRPPPGRRHVSLRTWEPGVNPPSLAVEVVSENNAVKDYVVAPDKYAASRTRELWVFDPLQMGPAVRGGPHRLQLWRRDGRGRFRCVYAGEGPAFSRVLSAWVVVTDGGTRLRVADDAAGQRRWPTEAERERARADEERARADEERARADEGRARADEERARADAPSSSISSVLASLPPEALASLPERLKGLLPR